MSVPAGYIAALDLEPLLIDKDTGAPLTNGTIWFYQDSNRSIPKLVYQIENLGGSPPNYSFVALPNPVNLAAFGTQSDNAGNNVAIYYYPYDANGNIQLYFVQVYNSNGILQLTREAWPPGVTQQNGPANQDGNLANQLSNPQFAVVNFLPNNPLVITVTGAGNFTYSGIIADWNINVTATAATTITITRTAVAGNAALPNNPPYTLSILAGANVTALSMNQRLFNNPNIWAPPTAASPNGWLSATIAIAAGTTVTMQYQPNAQAITNLLVANNTSGAFATFNATTQLPPDVNPSTGDTGYVDIILSFPVVGISTFTNVQVVPLSTNIPNIAYDQTPVNRQIDQLFNYYSPLLQFKPVKSYLIGWDFPLNPGQFLGYAVGPIASGNNTSFYAWDQTIIFQSVSGGITTSQGTGGELVLTANANTQIALVQYLDQSTARDMLFYNLSSLINATTNQVAGISCNISLWYTTGTLPSVIGANNSIVATLNADGSVNATNAGSQPWVQVARNNLGPATFTLTQNGNARKNYGFIGWNDTIGGFTTATFFAIVVGFGQLNNGNTISIGNISVTPGSIPTNPSPQSRTQVLMECCRFYQKTFNYNVIPQQAVSPAGMLGSSGEYVFSATNAGAAGQQTASIYFNPPMSIVPTIVTYNPVNANAQVRDFGSASDCSATGTRGPTVKSFAIFCTGAAGTNEGDGMGVHWTADSRLGQ